MTSTDAHDRQPLTAAAMVAAVRAALAGGSPVAVVTVTEAGTTNLVPGARLLVHGDGRTAGTLGVTAADASLSVWAAAALRARPRITAQTVSYRAGAVEERPSQTPAGAASIMVQLHEAPARLVIVGGGHVGLALATLGEQLGYEITVIDDRIEFANRDRFPMAEHVLAGEVGPVLDALPIDGATYVVLVSRGHRVDEEALRHVIARGAAYVGMIGSRRRTSTVLAHLAAEGVDRAVLDAVATPVGLDIGAETPEEIAVAILAEMTLLRRGGTGQRMSAPR